MLSQLQTRIESHPEELLPMFEELLASYNRTKSLHHTDPKVALLTLDAVMHKVHCLQRLPAKAIPLSYEMWSKHLARIYNCCHAERDAIHQAHTKWSAMEHADTHTTDTAEDEGSTDNILHPWIHDWTDETLQSKAVLQMVKHIVVPMLYPHTLHTVHSNLSSQSRTLVIEGPPNTGKSYTLSAIRQYINTHHDNIPQFQTQWVHLSAYDCPPYAKHLLDEQSHTTRSVPANPNQWTIYVTDRVSHKDVHDWSNSSWCGAWDRHLRTSQNTLWVVLVTGHKPLGSAHRVLFPQRIQMPLPDSRTLYHYLKKCIYAHYGKSGASGKRSFPEYARLPVVEHLPQLAHFADAFVNQHHPDFEQLGRLFECTVTWSAECGLRANGAYGVPCGEKLVEWYPKHSVVQSKLPSNHSYKLLKHSKHDSIEWCPQTEDRNHSKCSAKTSTFWNVNLFDTLPSCEYDRFTQLYIDPETMSTEDDNHTYSVIGVFPLETNIFPYHLRGCLRGCYEWAVAFGHPVSQQMRAQSHAMACTSTADVLGFSDRQCSEVYGGIGTESVVYNNVTCASQVWYMERKCVAKEDVLPKVHITYGNRRSADIAEYVDGVEGDVSAETLQQILSVLIDRPEAPVACHVVQVQTHFGYAYYIDFIVALDHNGFRLQCVTANCESHICPRVQLPALQSGWLLDDHYCLCTEADVDALVDKFPQEYKDIYREEEATWKLKPVRKPAHLDHLNQKYSNEQRCYLKLCCDLLRVKESCYACLSPALRNRLDDVLTDVQNHLDYLLQIIPENDHEGKWNDVWSMSEQHPLYEAYHPPQHSEVDKVVSVNLATEWLRRGATFTMSPRWLGVLVAIGEAMEGHYTGKPAHTPLTQMVQTWKVFCKCDVQKSVQWVYVKSKVEHSVWREAKACGKLHECAYREMPAEQTRPDGGVQRLYKERVAKHSLFHAMFRRASHIGFHHHSSNAIRWMTFGREMKGDPLYPALVELNKEPVLWSLMCANTRKAYHPWLFALRQVDTVDKIDYATLYAHLLFSPTLSYWSLEAFDAKDKQVLVDIQRQTVLDRFVRQYAYIHKQMHRKQLELNGSMPGKYVRSAVVDTLTVSSAPQVSKKEKQVMGPEELSCLRFYGVDVHHFVDVGACLGGGA